MESIWWVGEEGWPPSWFGTGEGAQRQRHDWVGFFHSWGSEWTKVEVRNWWPLICFIWAAQCSKITELKNLRKGTIFLNHIPHRSLLSPLQPTFTSTCIFTTWALLALNCLHLFRVGAHGKRNMGFGDGHPVVEICTVPCQMNRLGQGKGFLWVSPFVRDYAYVLNAQLAGFGQHILQLQGAA